MIKSILVILFLFCLPSCAELKEEVLWKNISAVEAAKVIQENKRLVVIWQMRRTLIGERLILSKWCLSLIRSEIT